MTLVNQPKPERFSPPRLLTPAEVARTFSVDPKTVTRWAKRGLLRTVRTPGGHRRFNADEVEDLAREYLETEERPGSFS